MACCCMMIAPPIFERKIYVLKPNSDDVYSESLNGFKFGLIGCLVMDDGDEPFSVADLCDGLHATWLPDSTWRLSPLGGGDGYYLVQFSCKRDQLKVASMSSYSLKRGWMRIVQEWPSSESQDSPPTKGLSVTLVRWHPPMPYWIKVNTDGSSRGNPGPSSCGGVFRDMRGQVTGCFSLKLRVGSAFEAELQACITALDIARDRGWNNIWLESDSTEVVELLSTRSALVPRKFKKAWARVLGHLEFMEFRVSHIYREGNRVADALAAPDAEEGWWPCAIPSIAELVYEDAIGVVNARIR